MAKINGAEIMVKSLCEERVTDIFGYPGGSVLPLYDKIYDEKSINFHLMRHEQGAVHAADGYARATGKTGVCMATSGPGATNLVTGIATAHMDSIPIVAITGQVKSTLIGNDAFQEADIVGITRPITKHNYLVKNIEDLAKTVKEAFHIAGTGRPGPVLIDLPVDVQMQEAEFKYPKTIDLKGYKPTYKGHPGQIKKITKAIAKSKKPIIYAGGGVILSGASKELTALARKTNIPVTTTMMGLGVFPQDDKLNLGMLGMHGTAYANHAIQESDLILAIGARFDDRVTGRLDAFAPNATVVHIDIDPSSVSKNVHVDIPVIGDAKEILKELNKIVKKGEFSDWHKTIEKWKREMPLSYKKEGEAIRPQYLIEQIYEMTKGEDVIITTEVGQNQMWAAQYYTYTKPRTWISSGGLGTMGYGFPAAIGAQVGKPDSIVFDIAGDGSIQMNIQELATAVIEKVPVKIIILNNGYLGMVRQWQEIFYKRRYAFTCIGGECTSCPDFVKLAESYGAKGYRITKKSEVKKTLKAVLKEKGPVIVDAYIPSEENVFPMVPAGEAINKIIHGLA